jgi:3-hydroxybutyryl-CoA dehydrogenase
VAAVRELAWDGYFALVGDIFRHEGYEVFGGEGPDGDVIDMEVVRGAETSDETAEAVMELARELGKTPAAANDFPGFVSNRILMPYINEAVWALHDGVAEPEAIDTIAKLGFNHPMGPLALADLIGLDTCVAILEVLRDGLGDQRYEPCPLLRELVDAGKVGRKSGEGFFIY